MLEAHLPWTEILLRLEMATTLGLLVLMLAGLVEHCHFPEDRQDGPPSQP